MDEIPNKPKFDLEERTFQLALRVNSYIRALPRDIPNIENGRQLARSIGSIAANYIEANESFSRKDFIFRVKISRKESKESILWIKLTQPTADQKQEQMHLIDECTQIMKILGAIVEKSKLD